MKFTTLNGMGFKGLNTDLAPWELDPEYINSGINFRAIGNRIESAGSHLEWITNGVPNHSGHIVSVVDPDYNYYMSLGRSNVKVHNGVSSTDISSAAGYAGIGSDEELLWTSCMLGKIPVINNPAHVPEYWDDQVTTQVMQPLDFDASNTWSAKGYGCHVIRSHKNYLFALRLIEATVELPSAYRWSHPADINGLPFTWDPDDTSSLAGRAQLGGDSGRILDGLSLRDSFCMYSERGINILDSSNDEFVWRRRELSSAFGIISGNCVAEVKGAHFLLGDGDILINDGNSVQSIVHNKIKSRLTSNMSGEYYDRSFVIRNSAKKEIWFCVPENSAAYPNTAYVYNWRDNEWSIHDLPNSTSSPIAHACYGPLVEAPLTYDVMTDPLTEAYDTVVGTYAGNGASPLSNTVIGITQDYGSFIDLDPASNTLDDTDFQIERTNILLGDADTVKTITRIIPYIDSTDPVVIQIGSMSKAGGAVDWSPNYTFDPTTDRKIDIRSTGALHAYRVKSVGTGSVKMSGLGVKFAMAGGRP